MTHHLESESLCAICFSTIYLLYKYAEALGGSSRTHKSLVRGEAHHYWCFFRTIKCSLSPLRFPWNAWHNKRCARASRPRAIYCAYTKLKMMSLNLTYYHPWFILHGRMAIDCAMIVCFCDNLGDACESFRLWMTLLA